MDAQKPLYDIPSCSTDPPPLPYLYAALWEAFPHRGVFYVWLAMQLCLVTGKAFIELSVAAQKIILLRRFRRDPEPGAATLWDALLRMDRAYAEMHPVRRRWRMRWAGGFVAWEWNNVDEEEEGKKKNKNTVKGSGSGVGRARAADNVTLPGSAVC